MKKAGLIILDGWGHRESCQDNSIVLARTPHFDELVNHYPHTLLQTFGEAVGLPAEQMGNSEVGHLTIGAGRVVKQNLTRINQSSELDFGDNEQLLQCLHDCLESDKALHVVGLLSDGGVHSHQRHIFSLIRLAHRIGLTKIYLHAITDGRDTAPRSSLQSIAQAEQLFRELSVGKIATVCGRFYAMDRDNRWERTELAYRLFMDRQANQQANSAQLAVENAYAKQLSDEFVEPTAIYGGEAISTEDVVVMMNFRVDRMRQLTQALIDPDFNTFKTTKILSRVCTLTQYHEDYDVSVAFAPQYLQNGIGEYLDKLGIKQLRIAETEKYPHVTFFFNGGRDVQYANEERILIPSPKVTTYDQQPAMSAESVKDNLIQHMRQSRMEFFVCNFANLDMVGHTGDLAATIKAVETVDKMLGQICAVAKQQDWQLIITADHGNAELMLDTQTGQPHTAHTLSLVPFIVFNPLQSIPLKINRQGGLADVAPTLLKLIGQDIPEQMQGCSLLRSTKR